MKSKDEIVAALGPNGKNRGLIFDVRDASLLRASRPSAQVG